MRRVREQTHRLTSDHYRGERTIAFTACTVDRIPIFREPRAANDFAAILIAEAEKQRSNVLIACFMPDHVHALLQGREELSDGLEAFRRFKLRTGVLLDRFYRPARWQKDFYDHIVRCDGDWRGQAKYVALNPVRAGLVDDAFAYPFIYSSLDLREEIISQIFWDA